MAPNPSLTDISREKSIKKQGYWFLKQPVKQKDQNGRSFLKICYALISQASTPSSTSKNFKERD